MDISDILAPERVRWDVQASSKKRTLETLSELIAGSAAGLTPLTVFECLLSRERLGSTGLGYGVAIPHGRMSDLKQAVGAFMKLSEGVDYDALDDKPVDLLFGLLVPEESTDEHLQILSRLAEAFGDSELRERLRVCDSAEEGFRLITQATKR